MVPNKNWQKIEEWIVDKIKKDNNTFTPVDYRKIITREEPELDYQVFLEEASRNMIRFKKPEHLIKMIVRTIDEHVRTTHTAMLVFEEKKKGFILVDSKGIGGTKIPMGFIKLDAENPLIKFFNKRFSYLISDYGVLIYETLCDILKARGNKEEIEKVKPLLPQVLKQMDLLKAYICIPVFYKKTLQGVFILGNKLSGKKFSKQEIGFFTTLANDVGMALSNAHLIQDMHKKIDEVQSLYQHEHNMFIHTAISLAAAIDARDAYTHGHTERVTRFSLAIAEELEDLPEVKEYENFEETLQISALLHDVGKIGVPDGILNKRGRLTKEEYERIQEHPVIGATILSPVEALREVAVEVRAHHEKFDGTGYPDGLKGDQIPFAARIIAVADTFDAITSDRPYRQGKMDEVAMQILKDNSGTQFDPIVVSAFLLAYRKGRIVSNIKFNDSALKRFIKK